MIEEHSVHGFAKVVVAAQREREVAHSAADVSSGQILAYPVGCAYKIDGIVVVFFHAGGYGQDVRVEYYVAWVHAHLFGEQAVGACSYLNPALVGSGLSLFVEAHHHHGGTIAHHVAGVAEECLLAFLERNGVDDAFALHAFQCSEYHRPR